MVASSGLGHVARGVESWAADLAQALHVRGVDITLCKGGGVAAHPYERVLPCHRRASEEARRLSGRLPRWLAWRVGLGTTYGAEQVTFAWHLVRFLREHNADVLHVQDPLVARIAGLARQMRIIRTRTILAHGTEESRRFLRSMPWVQHLAPEHARACREAGLWRRGWTTIPNFIHTDRFRPGRCDSLRDELGIPRDALVVLTAAAIKRAHKRIDALLHECARLREAHPDLPVWLVIAGGKEADTDELVSLGRDLLGERVRFLVRFPRERMPDLYRAADVFVLASLTEMMPIALLEAAASALPLVVNDDPVLRWVSGAGGEAIDMASPGAMAAAVALLLNRREHRVALGFAAREHCVRHFGEHAVVGQVMEYYDSLLPGGLRVVDPSPARGQDPITQRVSVVIPTYNSGQWIEAAVDSVLAQTVAPVDLVVVDDGSTDDTRARLERYQGRIRYVYQHNAGVAAARNHGVALAAGSLIAFLDADDVWHPRKLELQLRAMAGHPEIGLIGARVYEWPAADVPAVDSTDASLEVIPWRRLVVRNRLATSSVMLRRRIFDEAGGFDPELRGPEDYDLWLRIAERATIATLVAPLTGYRTVAGSLGGKPASMEQGLTRILGKLDARQVWQSRWLLRCKARSYAGYSCAYMYGAAGDQVTALRKIVGSLVRYPLPYQADDVRMPWARLRLLVRTLLRWWRGSRLNPAGGA